MKEFIKMEWKSDLILLIEMCLKEFFPVIGTREVRVVELGKIVNKYEMCIYAGLMSAWNELPANDLINYHHELKTGGGGNEEEPDQDPMVPSSRAVMIPGLLSQRSTVFSAITNYVSCGPIWFKLNVLQNPLSLEFFRKFRQPSGVPSPAPRGKEGICPFKSAQPER
ncbi:hypothetical protein IEQ34_022686 [Dendrobium chrysotoxum]|uniref:Uncharacterized protein n=1 Tax=Dendrobium chrysotoxum TaxID=161865 RepID=A0AAV7FY03_DENCH|nr:hypothetical protein IEQ34_022686 [Dendrobium chrysotoxum]